MRLTAIATVALCLGLAGGSAANPSEVYDEIFIDFDPPNRVHTVNPDPYTSVRAYVVGDFMLEGAYGFAGICFMLSDPSSDCPGSFAPPSFTNLLPGNLAIGTWDTGITIASTECLTDYPVSIGYLDLYYLGGACDLMILDHPDYPRWVIDCQDPGQVFYYCVRMHGGIGKEAIVGDCPVVAVEDVSWGAIKSMYR